MSDRFMTALAQQLIILMSNKSPIPIEELYEKLEIWLGHFDEVLTFDHEAAVEVCLNLYCKQSAQYGGRFDLFVLDDRGFWSSKVTTVEWPSSRNPYAEN